MTRMESADMGSRARAMLELAAGALLCFLGWAFLPVDASGEWCGTDVFAMALLFGAILVYGRIKGILALVAGVLAALLGTNLARYVGQERGELVQDIWVSTIVFASLAYLFFCWRKRAKGNVILVGAAVVAIWTEVTVAENLTSSSFWKSVGSAPVAVFASWLLALVGGGIAGHALQMLDDSDLQDRR